jgi:hypothetical protein
MASLLGKIAGRVGRQALLQTNSRDFLEHAAMEVKGLLRKVPGASRWKGASDVISTSGDRPATGCCPSVAV